MTDYNDGQWHLWRDGKDHLHEKTKVEVFISGDFGTSQLVDFAYALWIAEYEKSIVAFRVVERHREPRTFIINIFDTGEIYIHKASDDAKVYGGSLHLETIKVVEVLDDPAP